MGGRSLRQRVIGARSLSNLKRRGNHEQSGRNNLAHDYDHTCPMVGVIKGEGLEPLAFFVIFGMMFLLNRISECVSFFALVGTRASEGQAVVDDKACPSKLRYDPERSRASVVQW